MKAKHYQVLLLVVFFVKVAIAAFFPLLSDEAHHILWGMFPSLGHADHPAMMGWFGAAFSWLGTSPLAYRTSCILVAFIIAEGIRRFLKPFNDDKSRLVAAIYILSPQSLIHLVVTPEIPVMLFSFFSVLCILKSQTKRSVMWALAAGFLQSAALSSKYNSLWLGAAAFYVYVIRPGSRSLKLTLAYGLGCLPAFALFYFYNVNNCWINLARLIYRMDGSGFIWYGPIFAILFQLWVGMPWSWAIYFKRNESIATFTPYRKLLPIFFWIPFACLVWVSFSNKIGMHWMASFYPFFFMLLVECSKDRLKVVFKWTAILSALHVLALCVLPFISLTWVGSKFPRYQHDIIITFAPKEVCHAVREIAGPDAMLATFDYSQSSTLWVACNDPFARYGFGRVDGREFDKIIDYRAYDGKPMAVLRQGKIKPARLKGALINPTVSTFAMYGKTFYVAVGTFSFEKYKREVLTSQLKNRYDPPGRTWPNDACYFKHRYFPELFSGDPSPQ